MVRNSAEDATTLQSKIYLITIFHRTRLNRITKLSLLLSLFIISTMAVLPHLDVDLLAQTPQSSVNDQVTPPLDVADSIYSANTSKFLDSKNISLTPYRMEEGHYYDQGFLRGVGNVTNNQTFIDTYLSDELIHGRGNGTFETPDGQSISWISSSIGRSVDDGRWVFHGIILFNNTQSESLYLLNNSIGLIRSISGNGTDYIWLLE
ncbi:MAG TPA: hypothetical protein VE378_05420 [Nitrososphaeraceae archaeon]|nr:hypothetical protein [Nitrososphaeraceae archaeon]